MRRTAWLVICLAVGIPLPAQSPWEALSKQGNELIAKKALPEAEQFFREAVPKAREAGERVWEAEFERAIGETFERRSDYRQARAQYQRALDIRLTLPKSAENTKQVVRLYTGTGLMSFYLRDDKTAVARVRLSVEGYREMGDRNLQARSLNLLGMILLNSKELEEATQVLEEGLAVYEGLGDKSGSAGCLIRLAEIAGRRGDYRVALQRAFQAQALQVDNPRQSAEILEILGNTFGVLRQSEKAIDYQRACLRLRLKLNDPRALAATYSNIGALLASSGDYTGALEETERALALRRKLGAPADIAANLNNLGTIQLNLDRTEEARRTFEESLEISRKNNYLREAGTPLDSLGDLARRGGKLEEAIAFHTQAFGVREQLADRLGLVTTGAALAADFEAKGDLDAALKHLEKALGAWAEVVAKVADPSQIGIFRRAASSLYPQYARVLIRSRRVEEALAISEQARGAGLARMSQLSTAEFTELLEPEDRKAWLAAAAGLGRATNRLRTVRTAGGTAAELADAEAAFFEAERELTQLRDRIFATNPRLQANDAGQFDVAAMKRFAKANPGTLVASWMVLDDRSTVLFVISAAEGVQAFELTTGRQALRTAAQRWLDAIGRREGRGVAPRPQATAASEPQISAELYRLAFEPLAPLLESGRYRRLALLPDGGLARVPFAALTDRRGKRLMESFDIATSVTFRNLLRAAPSRKASHSLYAVGDPLLPDEDRLVVPSGMHLRALPHARQEARALARFFPDPRIVIGAEAREDAVKKALSGASVLHFATHGLLAGDGMRSGLLLATEPADSPEDGMLQAWEISGMALSARLAVLSACDTGQGDEQLGEGVIGLAWAFQAAGCPNVIASLWSVDDAAARHLMLAFYGHLKARMPLDRALRRAMAETSRVPGFASPYYWAAFQMIGSGSGGVF